MYQILNYFSAFLLLFLQNEISDDIIYKNRFIRVSREILIFLLCEFTICVNLIAYRDNSDFLNQTMSIFQRPCDYIRVYILICFPLMNLLEHLILIFYTICGVCEIVIYFFINLQPFRMLGINQFILEVDMFYVRKYIENGKIH